jgi:hypothetical protein
MVVDILNPEDGFVLIFAGTLFPGYQATLEWRRFDLCKILTLNWHNKRDTLPQSV